MNEWIRLWQATRGEDIAFLISLAGFVIWLMRTGAYRRRHLPFLPGLKPDYSKLSVVVPARNEETNIEACLNALHEVTRGQAEIVVVDDQSTDQTAAIIESLKHKNVKLIRIEGRHTGGKNHACSVGAQASSREWILFTDADTRHRPLATDLLLAQAQGQGWDLTSALPFHLNPSLWEKFLCGFHALVFVPTAPYQEPTPQRLFAIGQYLLFKRTSYETLGGHKSIGNILAEDVELATRTLAAHMKYQVWTGPSPFGVRMYETPRDFVSGWRRNLRLGLSRANFTVVLEMIAVFSLFFNPFLYRGPEGIFDVWLSSLAAVATLWLSVVSREWGNFGSAFFTIAGMVVAFPAFILISLAAAADRLRGRSVIWKNRSHKVEDA